jgi:hypothetical protein
MYVCTGRVIVVLSARSTRLKMRYPIRLKSRNCGSM